jgi:hypothetical protein
MMNDFTLSVYDIYIHHYGADLYLLVIFERSILLASYLYLSSVTYFCICLHYQTVLLCSLHCDTVTVLRLEIIHSCGYFRYLLLSIGSSTQL